jgi:CO/xanthine dehydrogenase FAD-binding subunit
MTAYLRPASLAEALSARRRYPDYVVLAGGTDLLVSVNSRSAPAGVVDLFGLRELCGIEETPDGGLRIGAGTTYAQILADPRARERVPSLCAAASEVGALQIQARGTLGGNIATSSPVGDTLPVLLALDAVVELVSEADQRAVPYREFCVGYRRTQIGAQELIAAVRLPSTGGGRQYWRKVGTRRAQSISKVMVAGFARLGGGVIDEIRIGLGAVADRPLRALGVEAALRGRKPGVDSARAARAALAAEISPIDDVRSSAAYRLRTAQNLVARFVLSLSTGE